MMTQLLTSNIALFAAIPPDELADLTADFQPFDCPAGTVLLHEGDHGEQVYLVLSGLFEIVKELGTLAEYQLGLRGVGELLGEMSLLNQDGRRTASVRAAADSQLIELTRADFDWLLQRYPVIACDLLRLLSQRLRDANNATILGLQKKNRQLAQAYAEVQEQHQQLAQAYAELEGAHAQLVEKEALERELRLAREIQESILPCHLPGLPGLDLGARMVPAREVGGDFFDVFRLGEDALGLVVGDVCGKGMPSALFMAHTCSLLRAEASRADSPEAALRNVNRQLQTMNTAGMFVTLLYGILHEDGRVFTYARAGQDLPLILDASGNFLPVAQSTGHPLGLLPAPELDIQTIDLPPGATLLLYTDGVTEATNQRNEFFGLENLHETVLQAEGLSADQLCDQLLETLALYRGTAAQADDITLLVVRSEPAAQHR